MGDGRIIPLAEANGLGALSPHYQVFNFDQEISREDPPPAQDPHPLQKYSYGDDGAECNRIHQDATLQKEFVHVTSPLSLRASVFFLFFYMPPVTIAAGGKFHRAFFLLSAGGGRHSGG